MDQAAADLDFERAAMLRDRVRAITDTLERQDMARPSFRDQDVLGLARGPRPGPDHGAPGAGRAGHRQPGIFFPGTAARTATCWGPSSSSTTPRAGRCPTRCCSPPEIPDRRLLEALFSEEKGRQSCACWWPQGASGPGCWPWPRTMPGTPSGAAGPPRTPGRPSRTCKPA